MQYTKDIQLRQHYFNASHVNVKKMFNWFLIRDALLTVNRSGLYDIREFRKACQSEKINYNTSRAQISFFGSCGLLVRNKGRGVIKIVELTGVVERLYKLFKQHQGAIMESRNPKVYFADLWKRRLIKSNVVGQAYKEAEKCFDKGISRKFLRTVKRSKTPIGASDGINLLLPTIGDIIGRSRSTAHRAVERMNQSGIIEVWKDKAFVCHVSQIDCHKRQDEVYGKLFVRDCRVFKRMPNRYILNP
jgi:hypothetical protein